MRISDWSSDVCSSDLERIITSVINDSVLSDRKGLNRLGGGLSLGALTDRDRELIGIAVEMDVDFIAVSFCRNAADMEEARAVARAHGSHAALVSKIESAEAIGIGRASGRERVCQYV